MTEHETPKTEQAQSAEAPANGAEATSEASFDVTVESLQQHGDGVDVTLSDGSTGSYDLVVGADGLVLVPERQLQPEFRVFDPEASSGDGTALLGSGGQRNPATLSPGIVDRHHMTEPRRGHAARSGNRLQY